MASSARDGSPTVEGRLWLIGLCSGPRDRQARIVPVPIERLTPMARKPSHHGSSWTKSDDKKLFSLHARGAAGAAIARALGRTRSSVYQRLTTQKPRRKRSGR